MADPLSIAASVVAFVELANRIIRASRYCIDAVKDAPSDIQMILGEVSSIKAVIETFEELDQEAKDGPSRLISSLFAKGGPIEACQRCLDGLERLLPVGPDADPTTKRRGIPLVELAWPLKQSKARKLLAEISHHKATLLLAISGTMTNDIKEIQTSLRKLQDVMSDSERRAVFQWLERCNPSALHNTALHKHEPHTSSWLPRSPEWQRWIAGSPTDRFLWIHGLPGSGKTVMASFIINELKNICGVKENCCVVYYYCHYTHHQDEAAPFLTWTISQICRQFKWVPSQLKDLFDQGCDADIPELENILEALLDSVETLYLVVDAVDESIPRDDLKNLIATMAVDKRFRKIRILATSRQYFDIEQLFSGISISLSMSNSSVDEDIRQFVRAKLSSSRRLYRWRHMLGEIEHVLVSQANGMFRWAECQIQAIERLRDISQLRPALENLPRDISETYVRIFDAIPDADREFVRRILIWVIGHSEAPWINHRGINAHILLSAVSYDLYGSLPSTGRDAFECDYLQELCGCLLTFLTIDEEYAQVKSTLRESQYYRSGIEYGPTGSEKEATEYESEQVVGKAEVFVSLAHFTVLEFLMSPHIQQTPVSCFALSPDYIKSEFARSVLQQALTVDPRGIGTDWVYDREAYTLTLGCALCIRDFLIDPQVQDLYLQYLCPANPHFSRFWPIQQQLIFDRESSSSFYLASLPCQFRKTRDGHRDFVAETLLCLLILPVQSEVRRSILQRLLSGRSFEALLVGAKVAVSFVDEMSADLNEMSTTGMVEEEDTLWEVIQIRGPYGLSEWFNPIATED